MTTERNAQGVDVLAVMRRDAADAIAYRGPIHPPKQMGMMCRESDEARAAVAELATAADNLAAGIEFRIDDARSVMLDRLRAALLPFQSEAES